MKRKIIFAFAFATLTALPSAAQTSRVVTVEKLFDLVESGSKTLRERKTGVDAASHAVAEAKSRRLPDIDASLSVSYNGNVLMTDRDLGNACGCRVRTLVTALPLRHARLCTPAGRFRQE
ncbi:TolC family protein [Marseilla massiliensis]|uniref:TolC family protein n=1 Tax=Marseilla massiliensis TaxID=1841864 RepID=A0A938WUI3_9BACT|nr:TolC family protein [Marseilla massiliensis]MBM6674285.1 TolC family protein [Marseilla massiliensis]